MSAGPLTLRVLCPDGSVAEELTERSTSDTARERLFRFARLAAADCDDRHDRCCDESPHNGYPTGPHRIEQATWTEVARDQVDA